MPTDDENLTEDELLALPSQAIRGGGLSRLWAVRAGIIEQRQFDELQRELAGIGRAFMIYADQDPREKRRREEEAHRRQEYEQAMREITAREDRLLVQIEEQQREIQKRAQEIDERAIKLHDGRRAYVNGDGYVDGQGNEYAAPIKTRPARNMRRIRTPRPPRRRTRPTGNGTNSTN